MTKTNLTWNDGKLESSGKAVFILAEKPMAAEPGKFQELRDCPCVVAVAVPFGTTGYKVYDIRDDEKLVRNGKFAIWDSLADIKKHFEDRFAVDGEYDQFPVKAAE